MGDDMIGKIFKRRAFSNLNPGFLTAGLLAYDKRASLTASSGRHALAASWMICVNRYRRRRRPPVGLQQHQIRCAVGKFGRSERLQRKLEAALPRTVFPSRCTNRKPRKPSRPTRSGFEEEGVDESNR